MGWPSLLSETTADEATDGVTIVVDVVFGVVIANVDAVVIVVFETMVVLLVTDEATTTAEDPVGEAAAPQLGVVPFEQGMVSMYTGEHCAPVDWS